MSSTSQTPAPPIPRRHPSRPSLKSTPSDVSSSASPGPAPSAPGITRRPTSMFLNDDPGTKMASGNTMGFTGRVGLGSPRLEFFPSRREGSSDVSDIAAPAGTGSGGEGMSRPGSYIDHQSGLPSPPGTESDIGLPLAEVTQSSKLEAPIRPRLQPRIPSTTSSISPHKRTPSSTSTSSRRRIQPKSQTSTSMSRSTSSSSSIHTLAMSTSRHSDLQQGTSRTPSPQKQGTGQGHGRSPSLPSSSSTDKLSRHSFRRSSGMFSASIGEEKEEEGGTIKRTHSGSISPEKSLPAAVKPTHSRRSSRRSSAIHSPAGIDSSSESEAATTMERRISGGGDDLDDRIRQVEEKIKNVRTESSRPSTSPTKPAIRRHDSYSRQHSPSIRDTATSAATNSGTLRRSATLSSASASVRGSPWNGDDSPEKNDMVGRREMGELEGTERDKSGGSSGSGKRKPLPTEFRQTSLFTPSPKHSAHPIQLPSSSRYSRTNQLAESPEERISGLPSSSHFISPSRRFDTLDSPSTRFLRHEGIEGLDRSPGSSIRTRDRRQWSESLSGLPSPRTDGRIELREAATTRRAESVMDGHTSDRNRYQSRSSTLSSSSRLALTPGDSVSVVGSGGRHTATTDSSGKKDPLEVLKRIEQSRELHNRQWEEDRAASVLGDFDSSPRRAYRPGSSVRDDRNTVLPLRPATSMSSMRDSYDRDAPRSAPIHRLHQRAFQDAQLESPSSARRGPSRLSHGPISEPRPLRSSTSLAGRAGTALDTYVANTEHGRLLLEAFRALELKLPDQLNGVPDLVRALQSTILAQETINTCIRESLHIGSNTQIALDLGDPDLRQLKKDTERLNSLLRESNRASDQSIRDLTRVLLDLPKLLRESSRLTTATSHASLRNNTPSPASASAQNQLRRSGSIMSRTSLDSVRSPEDYSARYGGRNGQNGSVSPLATLSRERRSLDVGRSGSSMANFVSRFKGSPKKDGPGTLPPINQSPPGDSRSAFEGDHRNLGSLSSHSSLTRNDGYSMDDDNHRNITSDSLKSPDRLRNMLKKKSSSVSTHTIKGSPTTTLQQPGPASSTPFFPSPVRRTTTAISQITVGLDTSPPAGDLASGGTGVNRSKSIKSIRSIRTLPDFGPGETAGGEFSVRRGNHGRRVSNASTTDSLTQERGYEGLEEGEGDVDAAGLLAAAAQQREERNGAGEGEGGKGKMSGRWKNGWRRSK